MSHHDKHDHHDQGHHNHGHHAHERVTRADISPSLSGHLPTAFQRPDRLHDPLYVVTTVYNSPRFRSRLKLYRDFERMVELTPAAELYTVEVAFGDRDFAVTEPNNPRHIQLRTSHELWLKENAINLGVQRLPLDWKYVAWVDADVIFARPDWADETRHRLQHHPIVQMWSQYQDLDRDHQVFGSNFSFAACLARGGPAARPGATYPYYGRRGYPGAPGLAWACTRDFWDAVGGLLDVCILGAGDWYMAHALVGQLSQIVRREYHPRYRASLHDWEGRARKFLEDASLSPGVVNGLALHYFHGPKTKRLYATRDLILVDTKYNPDFHVHRDAQGLLRFSNRSTALRDRVRAYFHQRDEDAT